MVRRVGGRVEAGESGQALLELALTLPILLLLLVGAAEFGRLAYAAIETSNAARAGVAYGAQNHTTAANNTGMEQAAVNDGPNLTSLSATATSLCACSNALTSTSTCTSTFSCSGTNRIIEYVQVTTTASVNALFNYPGLPKTFTLTGRAIMRVEQ